ncbi:transposase [Variovorax paradoxus]|uniref:IS66 family transposase n=1 Tax=Variovorax paradoxus TaxID=34073 RepID=UPI0038D0DDC4
MTEPSREDWRRAHQERSRKGTDALHQWLTAERQKVFEGSATAKAIGYSLKHWRALTRYIDDGDFPGDNNPAENQIRRDCARAHELAVWR